MTDHDFPNPVALLRDDKGVYGVGFSDKYLQARKGRRENVSLILRPDRIDEACGTTLPILQGIPWQRTPLFVGSREGDLRDEMLAVKFRRENLPRHGFDNTHQRRTFWRTFFGIQVGATRVLNRMLWQAIESAADPAALRVARRFPPSCRWGIYKAGVRGRRALQLAEVFPALACRAYGLEREEPKRCELTVKMIERGSRLRDVAAVWGLPLRLRRVKPGAVHLISPAVLSESWHGTGNSPVLIAHPELLDHMPKPLPQMRHWLRTVQQIAADINPDYASWIARNWSELPDRAEIENLTDWVRADFAIEMGFLSEAGRPQRPFVPSMSVRTVRELSNQWHEMIERAKVGRKSTPFPEPWFQAHTLDSGEEIIPITNSADLHREGEVMHLCIASYIGDVLESRKYIYSIREGDRRIATFELTRDGLGKVTLGQIRGVLQRACACKDHGDGSAMVGLAERRGQTMLVDVMLHYASRNWALLPMRGKIFAFRGSFGRAPSMYATDESDFLLLPLSY